MGFTLNDLPDLTIIFFTLARDPALTEMVSCLEIKLKVTVVGTLYLFILKSKKQKRFTLFTLYKNYFKL